MDTEIVIYRNRNQRPGLIWPVRRVASPRRRQVGIPCRKCNRGYLVRKLDGNTGRYIWQCTACSHYED